ncbi:hypothetical protein [Actinoplanes palleronii]|uniref:Uncharacterized protein n=1 Tax=Actinoplanes palleronii TaxID=113570 RepID=A0ABQ4BBB0_9ACTN|nr:hypothetical protein [Actinoplanes palleronii]GIE67937.1 hypothetical protein Apa02nite_040450 [Actinoplanes palleronii]
MIIEILSILIGAVAGVGLALAIRGKRGSERGRKGLAVGIPIVIALAVWGFWMEAVPATILPFGLTLFLLSLFDNDKIQKS